MPAPRSLPQLPAPTQPVCRILPVGDCRMLTRLAEALSTASAGAAGEAGVGLRFSFAPCCTQAAAVESALRAGQPDAVLLQAGQNIWTPALHRLRLERGAALALLAVFTADAQAEAQAVQAGVVLDVNAPLEHLAAALGRLGGARPRRSISGR